MSRFRLPTRKALSAAKDFAFVIFDEVARSWGTLTEQVISTSNPKAVWATSWPAGSPYDKPSFCTLASVEGACEGPALLLLGQAEMIALTGLLLRTPKPELAQRVQRLSFGDLFLDGARELCNQMCGAAAGGVRGIVKKDISIVQTRSWAEKVFAPAKNAELSVLAPPFLEMRSTFSIPGCDASPVILVIPEGVTEAWLRGATSEEPFYTAAGKALLVFPRHQDPAALGEALEEVHVIWRAVDSLDAAIRSITADPPNVALVHSEMHEPEASEILSTLRADPRARNVVLLGCGSVSDRQSLVRILSAGAADFLIPPYSPERIQERVVRRMH